MNGNSSIYALANSDGPGTGRYLRTGNSLRSRQVFENPGTPCRKRGSVLEKDRLLKSLWPDSFVEEANLTQNIFVLRKILGDDGNGATVSFRDYFRRRGYKL